MSRALLSFCRVMSSMWPLAAVFLQAQYGFARLRGERFKPQDLQGKKAVFWIADAIDEMHPDFKDEKIGRAPHLHWLSCDCCCRCPMSAQSWHACEDLLGQLPRLNTPP